MESPTLMLGSYILRFLFRVAVLLITFYTYCTDRAALDFTQNTELLHPLSLLWLIFLVSFAVQLSPRSRISRGCLKQFSGHFQRLEETVDAIFLRRKTAKLDLGATKVGLAWAALNLIFAVLYRRRIIGVPTMLLLSTVYYVCDVICIVFYCPFQRLFMKNKCCVTCRIFAWGTIMIATPLIFIPHFYSWSLVALALVCTVMWEFSYHRHPERFCEETNGFLMCENCTDHLCVIKKAHSAASKIKF